VSGFGVAAQVLSRAGIEPELQLLVLEGAEKMTWGWALQRAIARAGSATDPAQRQHDEERLEVMLRAFLAGAVTG
jgi:hypothetical protein